jgi:hypothetical protein
MSRRAAVITQAHVARAIRAAKQAGAASVEVRPDGTIIVRVDAPSIVSALDDLCIERAVDDDLPPVIL